VVTDFKTGLWWFDTIKPGSVLGRHGKPMAPHINVSIFARGINIHLNTRIYFEDEADANANDPVMKLIELAPRRETLIAKRQERDGQVVYRFDIRLQGEGETVFFDV
jgi:protocatechuate 3,4-dioxygenase alpha subunit